MTNPSPTPNPDITKFIEEFEAAHFRTIHDTGAGFQTMFLWNMVRSKAGLSRITYDDLAAYCHDCKEYHVNPHTRRISIHDSEHYINFYLRRNGFVDEPITRWYNHLLHCGPCHDGDSCIEGREMFSKA